MLAVLRDIAESAACPTCGESRAVAVVQTGGSRCRGHPLPCLDPGPGAHFIEDRRFLFLKRDNALIIRSKAILSKNDEVAVAK